MASPTVPPDLAIETLIQLSQVATIGKYLSVAGLVALLYDHLLTLPAEVSLIWNAPRSFAKFIFLLNRYLVPAALVLVAYEMNSGVRLADHSCRYIISTVAMFSVVSIGVANILVLLRVVLLWERNPTASSLLACGFVVSFCATCTLMILTLVKLFHSISYSILVSMCVVTSTAPTLIAVWASPMLFEILVLVFTYWNAFSRPREARVPLARALHRDGVLFFITLTILRAVNLGLASTSHPEWITLAVFFVWSMTTLVLNRSLLRLQRAEMLNAIAYFPDPSNHSTVRAASPFGIRPTHCDDINGVLGAEDAFAMSDIGHHKTWLAEPEPSLAARR